MKSITKIDEVRSVSAIRKTRIAAYARVSTSSDEQLLSLDNQKEHYENYIRSNAEWEYAGLYFDEGISGTSLNKRDGLKKLVDDCDKGLIDIVLTKSISRFCRNTTDCLAIVRKLNNIGVAIIFEKEKIDTSSMESELMLSILASMAEEESVSISENTKWSIKKRFQNGTYIISYPPYGYANVDGEMVIVPDEAETIRKVFADLLNGKSTHKIAEELNERGIHTRKGPKWNANTINGIIKNEKYTGDVIFQKTYTDDGFTRHRNNGEYDQYFCENHHEAIISHEIFEKANALLYQRGREKGNGEDTSKYQNRYAFSARIVCGCCGRHFKRRQHYKPSGNYIAWTCAGRIDDVNSCSIKYILDDAFKDAFVLMMNKLAFGCDKILIPFEKALKEMSVADNGDKLKDLELQMEQNMEQRTTLSSLLNKGYLDRPVYLKSLNALVQDYDNLVMQRDMLLRVDSESYEMLAQVQELIAFLKKTKKIEEYSEELFDAHVDTIKVLSREEIQFNLRCGLVLTERL